MKEIIFYASSSCGDILYALPAMRELCEQSACNAVVQINPQTHHAKHRKVNTYQALHRLLEVQPFISRCEMVTQKPGGRNVYDLDLFRQERNFRKIPIWVNHAQMQGVLKTYKPFPFLHPFLKDRGIAQYSAVSWSGKYRGHAVDIRKYIEDRPREKFLFIGVDEEFKAVQGLPNVRKTECYDLYDVAYVLNSVRRLVCDQSSPLVIMQGLGRANAVSLAKDRAFNNCITGHEEII